MDYSSSQLTQSLKKLTKSNVLIQEAKVVNGTYDADTKSVDVIPLTSAFGTRINDVRIKAKFIFDTKLNGRQLLRKSKDDKSSDEYRSPILEGGIEYIPADGSNVIIAFIDGFEHEAVILAYSNLKGVQMTVEENRFLMDKNEIQLKNITRSVLPEKVDNRICEVESTEEIIKNEIRLDKTQIVLQQYDPEEGRVVVKQFEEGKEPEEPEAEKRLTDPPLSQVIIDKGQIVINHYDAANNLVSQALVTAGEVSFVKNRAESTDPKTRVQISDLGVSIDHFDDENKVISQVEVSPDGLRFLKNQNGSSDPQTMIDINDSGAIMNHYNGNSEPNTQIKLEADKNTITVFSGGQAKSEVITSNEDIRLNIKSGPLTTQSVVLNDDGLTLQGSIVKVQATGSVSLAAPSISIAPAGGPGGPGSISLNGGGKGGMVDAGMLLERITKIEKALNEHQHTYVPPSTGAALVTTKAVPGGLPITKTTIDDIQNENITHG